MQCLFVFLSLKSHLGKQMYQRHNDLKGHNTNIDMKYYEQIRTSKHYVYYIQRWYYLFLITSYFSVNKVNMMFYSEALCLLLFLWKSTTNYSSYRCIYSSMYIHYIILTLFQLWNFRFSYSFFLILMFVFFYSKYFNYTLAF